MKFFPKLVTFHFSTQLIPWSWIGEFCIPLRLQLRQLNSDLFPLASTLLSDLRAANHPILRITQAERLFRLVLTAGVVIGIVAASSTTSTGPSNTPKTKALRITSVAIFLALTVVQAIQTGILATSSISGTLSSFFPCMVLD